MTTQWPTLPVTRDTPPRDPSRTRPVSSQTTQRSQGASWSVADVFPTAGSCADRMARYKMIRQRGTHGLCAGTGASETRGSDTLRVPACLRRSPPGAQHRSPTTRLSAVGRARTAGQIARGDGFAESIGEASRV
jgi:hypothetical protein